MTNDEARSLILAYMEQFSNPQAMASAQSTLGGRTSFPRTVNGVNQFINLSGDSPNLEAAMPSILLPRIPIGNVGRTVASTEAETPEEPAANDAQTQAPEIPLESVTNPASEFPPQDSELPPQDIVDELNTNNYVEVVGD
jgi:hypothetical protein